MAGASRGREARKVRHWWSVRSSWRPHSQPGFSPRSHGFSAGSDADWLETAMDWEERGSRSMRCRRSTKGIAGVSHRPLDVPQLPGLLDLLGPPLVCHHCHLPDMLASMCVFSLLKSPAPGGPLPSSPLSASFLPAPHASLSPSPRGCCSTPVCCSTSSMSGPPPPLCCSWSSHSRCDPGSSPAPCCGSCVRW